MPTRRSTAEAFQILISHAFGDAGSPYMIGLISEALKATMRTAHNSSIGIDSDGFHSLARRDTNATYDRVSTSCICIHWIIELPSISVRSIQDADVTQFKSLQYALFSTSFVEVLGGVFFLLTSAYIIRDKSKVEAAIAGKNDKKSITRTRSIWFRFYFITWI